VLALIDAVMSFAIDMLQTGKRLQLVNSQLAVTQVSGLLAPAEKFQ
jgi:hypothetical protein